MKTISGAAGGDIPLGAAEAPGPAELGPTMTNDAAVIVEQPQRATPETLSEDLILMKKNSDATGVTTQLTAQAALLAWRDAFVDETAYAEDRTAIHRINTGMEMIHQGLTKVDRALGDLAEADKAATPGVVVDPATDSAKSALARWLDVYVRNTAYARDTEAWDRIHGGVEIINAVLAKADAAQIEVK